MKPYPENFIEAVIATAKIVGTREAAKRHGVSSQSVVTWLHRRGLTNKPVAKRQECKVCNSAFPVRKSGPDRLVCSSACRYIYERSVRNCRYCQKQFIVIRSSPRKFCSHSCYALSHRKPQDISRRRGSNWNTIRRRFKRNPESCLICGVFPATDLHHVIPFKYFKGDFESANKSSNLAPLCQSCHRIAEGRVRKTFKVIEMIENA